MITIPQSFALGGRTWEVLFVQDLPDCGDCDGHAARIRLREGMTNEETHHTFYHELSHAICYTLGWKRLNKAEDKIDALGGMMYQFLNTKKGNLFR